MKLSIERINECTRKKNADGLPNQGVIEWSQVVIKSGWLQQLWPVHVVGRHGLQLRYREGKHGLPAGMHQDYFDAANRERKILGWSVITEVFDASGRCQSGAVSMSLTL